MYFLAWGGSLATVVGFAIDLGAAVPRQSLPQILGTFLEMFLETFQGVD